MKLGSIFGKPIAYIPTEGLMEDHDTVAEFHSCDGEDFYIVFYDPDFENVDQALLHENIHAILHRTGIEQTSISEDVVETICENISVFITESYHLKPKV